MSENKVSAPLLMVLGSLLVVGSVGIVTTVGVKVAVQRPLSEAASSIRIISPNGGQTFNTGATIKITYTSCDAYPYLGLTDKTKSAMISGSVVNWGTNPNGTKFVSVILPSNVPTGQYYLSAVCIPKVIAGLLSTFTLDHSDTLITIKHVSDGNITPVISSITNVKPSNETVYLDDAVAQWLGSGIYRYSISLMRRDLSGAYKIVTQLPNTMSNLSVEGNLFSGLWPANFSQEFGALPSSSYPNSYNFNMLRKYVNSGDYDRKIFKIKVIGFDPNGKQVASAESAEPFMFSTTYPPTSICFFGVCF